MKNMKVQLTKSGQRKTHAWHANKVCGNILSIINYQEDANEAIVSHAPISLNR